MLYRSKLWTITERDARRTATEIKYVRKTAGYTWTGYKTNTETAKAPSIWTKYRNTEEIGCNI